MATPREHGLRADDGIVLRTPLLPLDTFVTWAEGGDLTALRRTLGELIARPEIDEAIFVASPGLHGAIAKWREAPDSPAGQRAEQSLVKYVSRMAGRSTPFGLFSAVSAGKLGGETRLELAPRAEYRRRTRLDNDFLFACANGLTATPEVRAALTYRPSTSIYRIAGRLRYAAARLEGNDRSYHLVSVEPTPYLEATLARAAGGAKLEDLAAALAADDPDVTLDDARGYLAELVDAQLLIPDLGVFVTGPEPIDGFCDQLAAAGLEAPRAILAGARAAIAEIDAAGLGNSPDRYRAIADALAPLPAKIELSLLFQVDAVKPAAATIGNRVAAETARAIAALRSIAPRPPDSTTLDDFKKAFGDRWESRRVPLAEVLDEESGIGFERASGPGSEGSPLLAGVRFNGAPGGRRGNANPREVHLARRLAGALAAGATELALDDADLEAMKNDAPPPWPDAMSSLVQLRRGDDGDVEILLEGASGPSGAKLLGRFCHASPEIDAMVRRHLRAEEALRPDALFAEIVHLNEGRIGNILCRPVLREHEVVFLGVSGAPEDKRITLDDLDVEVAGGRINLYSRRLGKQVIPRLTTAHNFRLRSLGVYRFLCALADQDGGGFGWSWGALDDLPFLPRVRLGKVILSRATWTLDKSDLAAITAAVKLKGGSAAERRTKIADAVAGLRDARKLPRFVALAAGDNELPIDLDNPLSVGAFADEVSGAPGAKLVELFGTPDRALVTGPEGRFANEVVLTFVRPRPPTPAPTPRPAPAIVRTFPPGSPWLYAKLYCGASTGDRVLRDAIAPVVRGALAAGDATHWFFIRYADPDEHVRVRIAGDPARLAGAVLPALHDAVAPLLADGAVHRVVLDTYQRELERYGGDAGIEICERIFWADSEAVLGIVELLDGDAGADARWRLTMRGIDSLLVALGLDEPTRVRIIQQGRDNLGTEHRADADFWSRLGERFNKDKADLTAIFAADPAVDAAHDLEPGFTLLAQRDRAIAPLADALRAAGVDVAELAWSLCHMHANRLLHASQRTQELVLYEFLRRLHGTRRARGAAAK